MCAGAPGPRILPQRDRAPGSENPGSTTGDSTDVCTERERDNAREREREKRQRETESERPFVIFHIIYSL